MDCRGGRIRILASAWQGALYALVTLGQMVRNHGVRQVTGSDWGLKDAPRFAWRGIMIDSARHFTDPGWLMDLLDAMEEIRMNVLHWHLSDDQGWRFAVPGWPALTDRGAWRSKSEPDGRIIEGLPVDAQGRYGGLYDDAWIRQFVAEAARRNILVVPEVDVPGHSGAALAACHDDLACQGPSTPRLEEPPVVWGVLPHVLCPGKDRTFEFFRDVTRHLADLFPSLFLHLGGDEVQDIHSWEDCPRCRERMTTLGLEKPRDLEGWFVHRCQEIIRENGRIPMAWDDVIAQILPRNRDGQESRVAVPDRDLHPAEAEWLRRGGRNRLYHFWSNRDHLARGLGAGEGFVFSPSTHLYLDMTYGEPEPRRWAGYIPFSTALSAEPADWGLPDSACLGIEAPLWTEHLPRNADLDRLVWPRLVCAAEAAWVARDRRDAESLTRRTRDFTGWLASRGIGWHPCPELE